MYVKRKEGSRGLMQVEAAHKAEIINFAQCLNTNYKKDQLVNIVKNRENTQPVMKSVAGLAAKIMEELGPLQGQRDATPEDRRSMKAKLAELLKKKWES